MPADLAMPSAPHCNSTVCMQVWGAASALTPHFSAVDRLVAANLRRVQVKHRTGVH